MKMCDDIEIRVTALGKESTCAVKLRVERLLWHRRQSIKCEVKLMRTSFWLPCKEESEKCRRNYRIEESRSVHSPTQTS